MIIGLTKLLQNEVNKEIKNYEDYNEQPVNRWIGHLFKISRYKCVIFMNEETRYSFMVYRLKKKDFENIEQLFKEGIEKCFFHDDFDEEVAKAYLSKPIIYTNTFSRSILGSIKEVIYYIETLLYEHYGIEDPDIDYINHELGQFLHMPLGPHTPVKLMHEKLKG